MWNDWHSEVRRAAAQCLGKTGHGRDVHDDLCKCITEGDERLKLEAISKVGQLGMNYMSHALEKWGLSLYHTIPTFNDPKEMAF